MIGLILLILLIPCIIYLFWFLNKDAKWLTKANEYISFFHWTLVGIAMRDSILEARELADMMETVTPKALAEALKAGTDLKTIYPASFHDILDRIPDRIRVGK